MALHGTGGLAYKFYSGLAKLRRQTTQLSPLGFRSNPLRAFGDMFNLPRPRSIAGAAQARQQQVRGIQSALEQAIGQQEDSSAARRRRRRQAE